MAGQTFWNIPNANYDVIASVFLSAHLILPFVLFFEPTLSQP
jgi:hypothetical protein